ncbi:hypothetical protein ElyMa_003573500 [Elysia marginata]|uniref:Uncharacterized protein n=1 Tax=Elysia marginata TaxID=1093978 RepID=A0AAV4ELW1_9GAST|nr:hypothetical protein ElyMa_003573500 [Elysia marginata]
MILTRSSQQAGIESHSLVADSLVSARRFSTILYIQEIIRSQPEAGIPLGRLFGQSEAGIPLAHITLGKRGESLAPQRRRAADNSHRLALLVSLAACLSRLEAGLTRTAVCNSILSLGASGDFQTHI